jgi:hypothetical protein
MQMLDQEIAPAVGSTWRPFGTGRARLRPSPGWSNGRTCCTSWAIERLVFFVFHFPWNNLTTGMPDAKVNNFFESKKHQMRAR